MKNFYSNQSIFFSRKNKFIFDVNRASERSHDSENTRETPEQLAKHANEAIADNDFNIFFDKLEKLNKEYEMVHNFATKFDIKNNGGVLKIEAPAIIPPSPSGKKWFIHHTAISDSGKYMEIKPNSIYIMGSSKKKVKVSLITEDSEGNPIKILLVEAQARAGENMPEESYSEYSTASYESDEISTQLSTAMTILENEIVNMPQEARTVLKEAYEKHPEVLPFPIFLKKFANPEKKEKERSGVGGGNEEIKPSPPSKPEKPLRKHRKMEQGDIDRGPEVITPEHGKVPEIWQKEPLFSVYTEIYDSYVQKRDAMRAEIEEARANGADTNSLTEKYNNFLLIDVKNNLWPQMSLAWLNAYPISFNSPIEHVNLDNALEGINGYTDAEKLNEIARIIETKDCNEREGIITNHFWNDMYLQGDRGFRIREYANLANQLIQRMQDNGEELPNLNNNVQLLLEYIRKGEAGREGLRNDVIEELRGERTELEYKEEAAWETGRIYLHERTQEAFNIDDAKVRQRICDLLAEGNMEEAKRLHDYYSHEMRDERIGIENNVAQSWIENYPLPQLTASEAFTGRSSEDIGEISMVDINAIGDGIKHLEIMRRRKIKEVFINGQGDNLDEQINELNHELASLIMKRKYMLMMYINNGGDINKIVDRRYHRVLEDSQPEPETDFYPTEPEFQLNNSLRQSPPPWPVTSNPGANPTAAPPGYSINPGSQNGPPDIK